VVAAGLKLLLTHMAYRQKGCPMMMREVMSYGDASGSL